MYKYLIGGLLVMAVPLSSCGTISNTDSSANKDAVYEKFPVTVKGYKGSKKSSLSYTGQIARHTLHESCDIHPGVGPNMSTSLP